jgi:beta-xylosidase
MVSTMRLLSGLCAVVPFLGAFVNASPVADSALTSRATTFNNPALWEDYPDLDVFRVGNVYYYSSSTFAFSPGAPVLKSYDLINWEPVTHSVPELNFGNEYNLNGQTAYVKGIYASTLRYRQSKDMFYWMGCVNGKTWIWTAPGNGASSNNGEVGNWTWTARNPISTCYYDCGLLIDDNDTMYVAYGNTQISVAQLSADGFSQTKTQVVYKATDGAIEGSRMYKINGQYYIFVTRPADSEFVLKSSSPFGPYTRQSLVSRISGPLQYAGFSHQGGVVNTPDNKWYYVAFMDAYPGGRIPVVAPLTWTSDGWPQITKDSSGAWGKSYPMPVQTSKTVSSRVGTDEFKGGALSHEWEWNHNPDKSKFSLDSNGGLILQTSTVTNDLYQARNTLTHRIIGPKSSGTFRIDVSQMKDGDRAGAVLFRDRAGYIAVYKDGNNAKIVMVNGLGLSTGSWKTSGTGNVAATGPTLASGATEVWLRITSDITPAYGSGQERQSTFSYSTDGNSFTNLGPSFSMTTDWQFFTGYRFGVFNHATKALGGQVKVKSFTMVNV